MTDLTCGYGAAPTPVLRGVSVSPPTARFTALVGPNGCGKSTLLKAVMGLLPHREGAVEVDGVPVASLSRRALAQRVSYLPQDNQCPENLTIAELVELGGYARFGLFRAPDERERRRFEDALETVGLSDLRRSRVSALSGGQRQRAWIAMVLAQDAPLLLLDEPVNHLDLKAQIDCLALLKRLTRACGHTVLAVLHDLNLAASFADHVVMMRDGAVIGAGPAAETLTEPAIDAVFGLGVEVFHRAGRLVCLPRLPRDAGAAPA